MKSRKMNLRSEIIISNETRKHWQLTWMRKSQYLRDLFGIVKLTFDRVTLIDTFDLLLISNVTNVDSIQRNILGIVCKRSDIISVQRYDSKHFVLTAKGCNLMICFSDSHNNFKTIQFVEHLNETFPSQRWNSWSEEIFRERRIQCAVCLLFKSTITPPYISQ